MVLNPMHPLMQANFLVIEKGFFSAKQCLLNISADKGIVRTLFIEPRTEISRISWDQLMRVVPSQTS